MNSSRLAGIVGGTVFFLLIASISLTVALVLDVLFRSL